MSGPQRLFDAPVQPPSSSWPERSHFSPSARRAGPLPAPVPPCRVLFPLDRLDASWACRVEPIVTHYDRQQGRSHQNSSAGICVSVPIGASCHGSRSGQSPLDLGLYKAELRGPDEFWATDGEGTEGMVHPLYHDQHTRMYYVEGTHDGRFLPRVTGKALVLFRLQPVQDGQGASRSTIQWWPTCGSITGCTPGCCRCFVRSLAMW